jgi:hypothetical protein
MLQILAVGNALLVVYFNIPGNTLLARVYAAKIMSTGTTASGFLVGQ